MAEAELTALGRKVAELQDHAPEATLDRVRGRARLLAEPDQGRARDRRGRTVALVTAFAALLVVAVVVLRLRTREPLYFALGPEAGSVGSWIAAPPASARDIQFSDGSVLRLLAGGRARVTALTADGAEVALEQGTLVVSVVHREKTRWSIRGGPFLVHVVGTRFEVRWDPATERFDVALREGAITLSGPVVGDARAVRAGERLVVTKSTMEVSSIDATTSLADPPPPPAPPAEASDAPAAPSAVVASDEPPPPAHDAPKAATPAPRSADPPRTRSAPPAAASASPASQALREAPPASAPRESPPAPETGGWRGHARDARYKDALAAAEADGFDAICASASAGDLRVLADAARLGGSGTRAVQAYNALRKRFPGTSEAAAAAFILGRMAQDQNHDDAHARGWFVLYLSEQPDGEFAADAMGRLVEAADRIGDQAGAVNAAERYLAVHPTGPHAEYAKRVLARRAPR
jgi:hypothetical protein